MIATSLLKRSVLAGKRNYSDPSISPKVEMLYGFPYRHKIVLGALYNLISNIWKIQIFGLFYLAAAGKTPGFFKRIWNSWIPIPTGVGIGLLGVLQWRRLERERRKGKPGGEVAEQWEISFYKTLPLRGLSRASGKLAEMNIPVSLRPTIYTSYAKFFGVNTNEMAQSMDSYPCFADFFSRPIRSGLRPLDDSIVISPADGRVLNSGKVTSFNLEQIKGITYCIKGFLGDISWPKCEAKAVTVSNVNNKRSLFVKKDLSERDQEWEQYKKQLLSNPDNDLYQCIIYLAPGDYHRFHSPADIRINFRRHISGELMSVNPKLAAAIPGLFCLNERAIYTGVWEHGFFAFIAVGATNVGSIKVYSDEGLTTNCKKLIQTPCESNLNLNWAKGEEIGEFRIGSTIVLLFEAPPNFKMKVSPACRVQVGCALSSNY